MRGHRILVLLLLVLTGCASSERRSFSRHVTDWIEAPRPEALPLEPKEWSEYTYDDPGVAKQAANLSEFEWEVYSRDDRVLVRRYGLKGPRSNPLPFEVPESLAHTATPANARVPDGWVCGFNRGEWGGGLWWFSDRGERNYRISGDRILGFFTWRQKLCALAGGEHASDPSGKIVAIGRRRSDERWQSETIVGLDSVPLCLLVRSDRTLLVVTEDSLVRVSPNGEARYLLRNAFWHNLYPNSIAADPEQEGVVYIGMRQGIAKVLLDSADRDVVWLVPHKEILTRDLRRVNELDGGL